MNGSVTCCLGVVQTQSSGLGLESGGQSMDGLGFSEQVTAPTLLSCPIFNYGQWACHKAQWQGKWLDEGDGDDVEGKHDGVLQQ